ncbi:MULTISPECIES: TIGR04168 family protein [unclassified Synechocystis]|uniref:TIGR04168 family protein n=1 Tax=unclassified Synechocystis TaxID=2640012 RepID=UPI000410BA76|nr:MULTISPECIES: TIGR04168 family protein [unclassified Synechocystis]AIE74056.1 Metallophosphoesterase [Synechocystis sp. PCC 6714]MCT0252705.1 TIGR04168 family protein [Synechocystis sp. CS-94]
MDSQPTATITLAVVGDIHEQWELADHQALQAISADLALFVGDFGNESLPVVSLIASLAIPKATVFGNHDAWFTASDWGRKKCPYDRQKEDRVKAQQELLGLADVSYGRRDFQQFNLSVVGGRPFTWGGNEWKNERFMRERYDIENFTQSQTRIAATAMASPHETLIFLAHNGPSGLGNQGESICGRDWNPLGGDFGDPDLAWAIASVREQGKRVPLVTFGHMHHRLRHRQDRLRERVYVDQQGTVYLNAACVPRIQTEKDGLPPGDRARNFSLVTLVNGAVEKIALVWLRSNGEIISQETLWISAH